MLLNINKLDVARPSVLWLQEMFRRRSTSKEGTESFPLERRPRKPIAIPRSVHLGLSFRALVTLLPAIIAGGAVLIFLIPHFAVPSTSSVSISSLMHRWIGSQDESTTSALRDRSSVSGVNLFGSRLFRELARNGAMDVFISPVSVAGACGMALLGAKAGEHVANELTATLGGDASVLSNAVKGLRLDNDSKVQIVVANSAWVSSSVRNEYVEDVHKIFESEVKQLPSQAASINSWVSKATNGVIRDIIAEIDANTVALLINAVYFKGAWTDAFDAEETVDYPFRSETGETSVRMMFRHNIQRRYGTMPINAGTLRLLELPYGETGQFAATIVLPADGATIADAVSDIHSWDSWMTALSESPVRLASVGLPKFRLEFGSKSIKPALLAMGVTSAWTPAPAGDPARFPRLSDDRGVYLSDVVHRAVVEVTEDGTTAAAVSAAVIKTRAAGSQQKMLIRMIVDRPFLFAVREVRSGLVLFLGRVDRPVAP
jgi:serine protease inhibitor